jgi:hypothetical protein
MGAKAVAVVLIWLCFLGVIGSGIFLLYNSQIVNSKSYYDTYEFKYQFGSLVNETVLANVKLKSVEGIKASGGGENVIAEDIQHYYSIRDRLSGMVNFKYYIRDTSTGEVITNIAASDPVELIKK